VLEERCFAQESLAANDHALESAADNIDNSSLDHRDFGQLLMKREEISLFTDEEKYQWLKNCWVPSQNYKFPAVPEGNKNRYFQQSWLHTYDWLAYSKQLHGGLCKFCIIFGRCEGGNNDVKLGKLVMEPMTTYKKATETMKHHSSTEYHRKNTIAYHNFCMTHEGRANNIVARINAAERKTIEENRKKLIPIIKTVILCGAQNIPLRGHRDDGNIDCTGSSSNFGEGNFRALLKFRVDAGDEVLASHLTSCGKNASYISKTTQNEIIDCCGEVIIEKIVTKIKASKFFTIMADETTDVSIKEQLSICIRYFNTTDCKIEEDFIKFVDVEDLTGESLARTILQELGKLNIDLTYCRGQAFDGSSNMSGIFKGVQARISKLQPLATYSHCTNHRLNLAISKACSVASIRNAIGVISSMATFFRDSAARFQSLEEEMHGNHNFQARKHGLKKLCETRWIERHEAVLTFIEHLPALPTVLEAIANSPGGKGSNAFAFLHSILSSEFLISVVVLAEVFGITLPLARKLQAEYMDVLSAAKLVETTIQTLQEKRDNSAETFKELYHQSIKMAEEMGTVIQKPRTTNLQKNRSNIQTETAEDYYRMTVYIPFLDFIISELNTRFPKTEMECVGKLQHLLSSKLNDECINDILQGAVKYKDDLPCYSALKGELLIWKNMWKSNPDKKMPSHPAEAYKFSESLPNIQVLLQLLCTLPVTTTTAERSFSTLRRLKTYLRSTMTEDRLNGLALLHVHQDISNVLKAEEVLDVYIRKHKRKLSLKVL
jgi:hypothetical protein